MNKLAVVVGVAVVATLAGCKDTDYNNAKPKAQNEVKNVDVAPAEPKPIETVEPEEKHCKCPPGTKHSSPCQCGAPDCMCVVEVKPVAVKPVAPAEPDYTIYVVQNGDYLAKISKKFNITLNGIRRLNPGLKNDVVRVGQKLKIPGKHAIAAPAPAAQSAVRPAAAKKAAGPYTGATKEYVVKSGDTLGAIAYGNGITIRQLKELNGLQNNNLRVGQKVKIPAAGKVAAVKEEKKAAPAPVAAKTAPAAAKAAPAPVKPAAPAAETVAPAPETAAPATTPAETAAPAAEAAAPAAETSAPAAGAEPATTTYVVQEGDDMTGVSIRWGVSAAAIRDLNNLADDAQLTPGQIIKLPADAQQ